MQFISHISSPLGTVRIVANDNAVCEIAFVDTEVSIENDHTNALTLQAAEELQAYFEGKKHTFTIPVAQKGTDFQQNVWKQLTFIPYGTTTSYGEIMKKLPGNSSARAVGTANGSNQIAIVIPCHRVIGANGALTGYAGGLWRKEWLLKHEGALLL